MKTELDKKTIEEAIENLKKQIQRLKEIDDPRQCLIEENEAIDEFLERVYKSVEPKDTVKKLWDDAKEEISNNIPGFIPKSLKEKAIEALMNKLEPIRILAIEVKNLIKHQTDKDFDGSLHQMLQELINKHKGQ